MRKLNCRVRGLLHLGTLLLAGSPALAASLQTNVNYGASGAVMNLYVPDKVDASPGIMVTLHYCGGSASNAFSWFQSLSDQYGFIVIAPGLPSGDADGCWDVGSTQTKTHNGGSHSKAVVQMVQYTITQYQADASRVCAAGASSGAMMTNVLLGAYPDVFAAGSVLAGVPFGCWTVADGWDSNCANGTNTKTAAAWGDLVRNAYSGYSGKRPRVQLFHGTSDTTLNYANLAEEVKQWTNVLGLGSTASSTQQNTPKSGWTRSLYNDSSAVVMLEVSTGAAAHDLTGQGFWPDVVRFCGLDQDPPAGTGGTGAGGAATGGRATGGVPSGGASSGGRATGGVPSGSASSGGQSTSGGTTTSGGQSATTGGTSSAGGASPGTGGTSSGGTGTEPVETCSCGVVSSDRRSGAFTLLLLAGLVSLLRGRRRSRAGLYNWT